MDNALTDFATVVVRAYCESIPPGHEGIVAEHVHLNFILRTRRCAERAADEDIDRAGWNREFVWRKTVRVHQEGFLADRFRVCPGGQFPELLRRSATAGCHPPNCRQPQKQEQPDCAWGLAARSWRTRRPG